MWEEWRGESGPPCRGEWGGGKGAPDPPLIAIGDKCQVTLGSSLGALRQAAGICAEGRKSRQRVGRPGAQKDSGGHPEGRQDRHTGRVVLGQVGGETARTATRGRSTTTTSTPTPPPSPTLTQIYYFYWLIVAVCQCPPAAVGGGATSPLHRGKTLDQCQPGPSECLGQVSGRLPEIQGMK